MKLNLAVPFLAAGATAAVVNQTTCGDTTYQYTGLAGYGFIPSNATDKYGDTIGGIGSSIAIDQSSWHKLGQDDYVGTVYAVPDRGWNTNGTLNFQNRIHKFAISLKLVANASASNPSKPNIRLKYQDTILLTGPDGEPTTGLDADTDGHASYPGTGGRRLSVDSEGIALASDGGFWISDEYGPYLYKFSATGRMEHAIQPPSAFLPRRNGSISFSSNTPPLYNPNEIPVPEDTESGRANNQGFEGVTISADGKTLYTLIQSALDQEGGPNKTTKAPARLLAYEISGSEPKYIHEWVVVLPKYHDYTKTDPSKAERVAAQSEIHQLPTGDFLVLARDSGFGRGQSDSRSVYRHADVFSVHSGATDVKGLKDYDTATGAIASSEGVVKGDITPAQYCPFLDYNVDGELAKFGLHNGGPQDEFLLNEKWESLALVPAGSPADKEYILISFSDNDFITQDGHMNSGKFRYSDESGFDLDTQVLAFHLKI
ncbi:secreted protein [Penicillium hetheringtonii]|uniref:Secreted protein n=1 Tax=Penicillium hetheringtonii TaxID=911720 RepID=A0AAD6GP88_9EURO|nr:secreted protein [Penicillium hetheringtonii]